MSEIKTPDLLNCPFCDGKAQWARGTYKTKFGLESVYCQYCMAQTAPENLIKDAAARWNTRPTALNTQPSQALEQRVAELDKWRVALESLTAEGGDFHGNLDACSGYIHWRRQITDNTIKTVMRHSATLESEKQALEQRLAVVTEALTKFEKFLANQFPSCFGFERDSQENINGWIRDKVLDDIRNALAESDRIAQTEIKL